ncbi:hypothetical protein ARHIZOSPH14_06470 [Agromyces rhizosphaerae]|uniref:Uncharacterized protein n=1 Tax=Agromyces rhizosphaerae TaxID=88374 RepID=A0A9W6CVE7_9MICO|nr:hypothetical protein [Agromyces rhizosphaerae]GLI26405.1 hypothetical protein ARHIZOSPH14_06470 [Agromyces rhizosphaerae]
MSDDSATSTDQPVPVLGISALIAATLGSIFAAIPPYLLFLGWILLATAYVLAFMALQRPEPRRRPAILAIVVALAGMGVAVYVAVVGVTSGTFVEPPA